MEEALEQTAQTTSPRLFLEVLKAPQASELTRKRKVASNPPVGKKAATCRGRPQGSSESKSVSAKDGVYVHFGHIHVSFAFLLMNNR